MQLLKNNKGFMHHPFTWMLIAFILGIVLTVLMAKQIIPLPWSIC